MILWLSVGIILIISEILIPGLIMVFLGMGALTVSLMIFLGFVDNQIQQGITFILSSFFYLLTLRFFAIRFIKTDVRREIIDEDEIVIGTVVDVTSDIKVGKIGRINHSGSSWKAYTKENNSILIGEKAIITGRENITWIVKKYK